MVEKIIQLHEISLENLGHSNRYLDGLIFGEKNITPLDLIDRILISHRESQFLTFAEMEIATKMTPIMNIKRYSPNEINEIRSTCRAQILSLNFCVRYIQERVILTPDMEKSINRIDELLLATGL